MKKIITALIPSLALSLHVHAADVDFDVAGDWNSTDWATVSDGTFTASDFSPSTDAGVGSIAGRLDVVTAGAANGRDAVNKNGVAETNTGTFTTSLLFLTGGVNTSEISSVGLGLVRSTGSFPGTFSDTGGTLTLNGFGGDGLVVGFRTDGDFTSPQFGIFRAGSSTAIETDDVTFADNNWYEMSLSITMTDATSGSYSAFIADRGADGTTSGANIATLSGSYALTNSGFSGASLFGYINGGNNSGDNVVALDNFSVAAVPESSAYAFLAGLGALCLIAVRRRR